MLTSPLNPWARVSLSASRSETPELVLQADCAHGTSVSHKGRAALIVGPSGSGKSALALQLMACGARLIADDRTCISLVDGQLMLSAPPAIENMIEARGLGILRTAPAQPAPLALVVDMGQSETHRLPPRRKIRVMAIEIDLVHNVAHSHFPAAVMQYIVGGRIA